MAHQLIVIIIKPPLRLSVLMSILNKLTTFQSKRIVESMLEEQKRGQMRDIYQVNLLMTQKLVYIDPT